MKYYVCEMSRNTLNVHIMLSTNDILYLYLISVRYCKAYNNC